METIYNKATIENLCEWLQTGSLAAYNYLLENQKQELIKAVEAILMGNKGLEWLIANKFYILSAFVKAVEGEANSINLLLKNKGAIWAATAAVIANDNQARVWLVKNGFAHYVVLATHIRKKIEQNKDGDFSVLYRGPY